MKILQPNPHPRPELNELQIGLAIGLFFIGLAVVAMAVLNHITSNPQP